MSDVSRLGATAIAADPLFDGPGAVRALARALDWHATPLGDPAQWPAALRTAVRLCLDSPFAINLWCGAEARVLLYNDAYVPILGDKHPAAFGRPGLEVWGEIRDALVPLFAAVDAGGSVYAEDAPFAMLRGPGLPAAWFTYGLSAIRDEHGAIVGYFNPAVETTARIEAEAALLTTRRRHDAALLAGEVGTFQWDIPEDRLYGDPNFGAMFGVALDASGAAPLDAYLAAIHPDDRERVTGLIAHTLATGAPYAAEYRLGCAGGDAHEVRWVEVRGRVERDGDGRPLRFPGVVQDVTRRRAAEAARAESLAAAEAARREAEQANRAKAEFLAGMSHELRTPLNAIGGHLELLKLGIHGPTTEAQQGAIERIARAQRHLLALITGILDFARLESGHVSVAPAPVRIGALVADVLPMIEPQAQGRGLALDTDAARASEVVAHADRERAAQVLLNLLSNAVKFTPPGGAIAVEVTPAPAGGRAAIAVRDTGIGIAADQLERIFEPFVQARRHDDAGAAYATRVEGTGLGLAISRDLARAMGGEVRATSAVGVGSTFVLELPSG